MQTLDDVTPVFPTHMDTLPTPPESVWGDRWYLLTHASSLGSDPRAQAAARTWNIRYVYVNSQYFSDGAVELSAVALSRCSAYQQVWHKGTVTIFKIVNRRY